MIRRLLVSVCVVVALLSAPVGAEEAASVPVVQTVEEPPHFTITLSEQDRRDLKRVEDYFNGLPPLEAKFTQTSQQADGTAFVAHGTFKLWRPGRLRIDYAPPNQDFVVADGSMIYQWDAQMHQQSQTRVDDTLAGFILKRNLSFSGDDVTATRVEHLTPQRMEITLRSVKDPGAGEMALVLDDVPLQLKGWKVLDAQGLLTVVTLDDVKQDAALKRDDFVFRNPEFGQRH